MSTRTHPSSQCKKLAAATQPLSQKRWRNKSHIVMGIESETSLELLLLIFARRKIQRTVITEVHLIHPPYVPWDLDFHIYEKETPCIAYLWRLFYTSFTTTTHFSTRLTYNPNKYFYQSEIVWILTELQCTLLESILMIEWYT